MSITVAFQEWLRSRKDAGESDKSIAAGVVSESSIRSLRGRSSGGPNLRTVELLCQAHGIDAAEMLGLSQSAAGTATHEQLAAALAITIRLVAADAQKRGSLEDLAALPLANNEWLTEVTRRFRLIVRLIVEENVDPEDIPAYLRAGKAYLEEYRETSGG
ncbi:hypothetical protein FF098_014690 [Parvularcula flava]|uniref:Uncharacterized protein n=1 Tax=Aquisalinus luteolus TaxID=1566827 RepID=A0A8J3A3E6_9PROT|nr:hypothetical protein [Aquisalinus luteolus]NHK29165.1 hypothetical protein [Aquisalinus luteolus]GGI00107.1 hypothetical protein GCM10011355_27620 [Aquisalinus luteolus]